MKASQMSINMWIGRKIMKYLYNGILLHNKNYWALDTHITMNKPQNNYAAWTKPEKRIAQTVWLHAYKILKNANKCIVAKNQIGIFLGMQMVGVREVRGVEIPKGHKKTFMGNWHVRVIDWL